MDITAITKIYSMFSDKEWTKKDGNKIVFKNFCSLIVNLTEEQQQLILDLTDRYTWITLSEYQSILIKVLSKVENDKLEKLKKIYFFPIMRPEDEGKTKSGHTVLYMVKAIRPILERYRHIDFEYVEQYSMITDDGFKLKDTESIFLLDDYLGSGETISATVEEIYKNRNIQPNHLNVISIASQFASIEFLEKINVKYYTELITKKGISDSYKTPDLELKIKLMQEIEELIPVNHFKFGYNDSEALITLMRTPDNTFPIFWKEHKLNGKVYEAPFSRYKI